MIESLKIKLEDGTTIELSYEKAIELFIQLKGIFDPDGIKYIPYTHTVPFYPESPLYPTVTWYGDTEIHIP